MEKVTGSASASETKTNEVGVQIKGEEFVFIDAPQIYFPEDAPLDTELRELYAILNELFQSDSGGGDVYLVSGSESGITVIMVKNRGETQELISENFTFNTKTYKTVTTLKSGKTTIEKTWSKTIITEVLKDGATVWKFTLDSGGNVTAAIDSVGNDVINGKTGADGSSVTTDTPEGIALGWALAYNNEQNSAMQKILDAYQDGVADCDEINNAEGVGGGNGDGEGGGDGTGDGTGGDGTGDGTGGIKLPEKSFGKYTEIPKNDNGGIPIPTGSGAFMEDDSGYRYTPDCIIIDLSEGTENVRIGMYNNDRSSIESQYKNENGEWMNSGYGYGNGFYSGYKLIDGNLYSSTGKLVQLSGDIYYVT